MKRINKKSGKKITANVCRRYGMIYRGKGGFTLVELLVVIAIIALLLSILMPALSKAKNQAYRVICRSQLHQVGLGNLMYAQDHKNQFPIGNFYNYPISNYGDSNHDGKHHDAGDDSFIALDIAPYLGTKDFSIFICPANKAIAQMPASNFDKVPPKGMTTYKWYKSGNLNLDGTTNYGYFIYYYYFGNYAYEGFNTSGSVIEYLSYNDLQQKNKGLIYPTSSLGRRAKLMQDVFTEGVFFNVVFSDSHKYPNGLYTDGSVDSLNVKSLKAQRRGSIGVTHYW